MSLSLNKLFACSRALLILVPCPLEVLGIELTSLTKSSLLLVNLFVEYQSKTSVPKVTIPILILSLGKI